MPDFIRYYWNSKNKTVRSSELFKMIRGTITSDGQVFGVINEMLQYSDIYMALKNFSDELWQNEAEIQENINLLNIFNLKQPVSMLMAAYMNLPKDQFVKVLKDSIIASFRYSVICGKNPNEVERVYNEIAMQITKTKSYSREILRKIYVEDDEFNASFETKTFPENSRSNKIIKYILGKYERFKGGREVNFVSEIDTIEHIYPQSPSDEWEHDDLGSFIYRLGNLCLLEKNLNRDIENRSYADKIGAYKKSSFVTTRAIPDEYPEWNQNNILRRQKQMSLCAKSIWRIDF